MSPAQIALILSLVRTAAKLAADAADVLKGEELTAEQRAEITAERRRAEAAWAALAPDDDEPESG